MNNLYTQEIEALWEHCGQVDVSATLDDLKRDIVKFSHMIDPCRVWLADRNKLKNLQHSKDSYTLKHLAADDIGDWVPHSVFVLSAYLEGFKLSKSKLRGDVYVVSTNIGAKKR
ncbi:hypothetical protein PO80_18925 [Vibrio parahaemolyticus]|nr:MULTISPECIES: hypothetical protein [Vibrio harveyi group]KHF13380.1 hypothetical protein PO80_18925 [Vibrio parahaemolyticus]MCG6242613.1 hypothetical protein [Vibrio diabolicus]OTV93791.1 hypothetical protein BA740_13145 [Vibrio parahaemolyticus]OTW03557.1 hypothetical protein BA739_14360 [Vibrio parahaemolyticus]